MNEIGKSSIRVLVAEDHPVVADGIVAILANAENIVVVGRARDGAQAIELIKRHQPDIVLLDLRMPVVDGLAVARWIKRSGSPARTIILTAFRSPNDISQALQAGASAYLAKDVSPDELLQTIRRVNVSKCRISGQRPPGLMPAASSSTLKPSELEILTLIVQGYDNRTIGSKIGLGTDAVKYRLRGLFSKLGVRRRSAAARQAIDRGLLEID